MTRSRRTLVRALGAALALVLVLGAAGAAVAQLVKHTEVFAYPLPEGSPTLELRNDVGAITVRAVSAGEEPQVLARAQSSFRDPRLTADGTSYRGRCLPPAWLDTCEVRWEIRVPAGTDLDLRSAVGAIHLTGLEGRVAVRTSVGDIQVTDSASTVLELDSSVGDIALTSTVAPESVTAASSIGDVRVLVPDDGTRYRVDLSSSLGETRNELGSTDDSDHIVRLTSSLGDVIFARS